MHEEMCFTTALLYSFTVVGTSSTNIAVSTSANLPSNNASNHCSPTAVLPPNLASRFRNFSENGGEKFSAEFEVNGILYIQK